MQLEKTIQISELKSNLITQAAHELKTPLTSIFGWTELLYNAKKQGKSLDATFELEDFERILRNSERLDNIINDFLDMRRIESGKIELVRLKANLSEILEKTIEVVNYLAIQKGITFTLGTIPSVDLSVDLRRIEQVFINLLSNAIKYSPENTRVTIKTNIVELNARKMFQVQVIDEGYGFTTEELTDATTPFGKAYTRQKQKRAIQGTGLGLYISRHIIELHGGTLEIQSDGANRGTQVEIRLPLDQ
ncbi:MAG: sensory transduction histidine kinase [Promethearchaeota archaeon CR_4]|nr:MAG: sensory transduction histidine kinase [Candidatus Lokiarchaeota archaeon CR_4]